jgi:hypothetical protein
VLSIRKNGIELIDTPVYSADQSKEKQLLKIKLNEDNSISGEGNFSTREFSMIIISFWQRCHQKKEMKP